jgi:hypothetical protein
VEESGRSFLVPFPEESRPKLLDQVRHTIRTRHYSRRAESTYVYNRAVATDVVPFLKKLASGSVSENNWNVLWDYLHHQGDVGEAPYAVVPYLVEYARVAEAIPWHVFGFTPVIELERTENRNPPVQRRSSCLTEQPSKSFPRIGFDRIQAWGKDAFEPFMACVALSLSRRLHARAYLDMSESEIEGFYRYMENASRGDV